MDPFQPTLDLSNESSESLPVLKDITSIIGNCGPLEISNFNNSSFFNASSPIQPFTFLTQQRSTNTHTNISNGTSVPDEQQQVQAENIEEEEEEEEEPVNNITIYSEQGEIKLERRKLTTHQQEIKKKLSSVKIRGKRCTQYQKNSAFRAKSRYNNTNGLLRKMQDLKMTTGDEVFLKVFKDYGKDNCCVKKFATLPVLLNDRAAISGAQAAVAPLPSIELLTENLPSKARKKRGKYVCQLCGIEYDSDRDKRYDSSWIGCEHTGCDRWQHYKCMGLIMSRNIKSVKWTCQEHTPAPPKAASKKKG